MLRNSDGHRKVVLITLAGDFAACLLAYYLAFLLRDRLPFAAWYVDSITFHKFKQFHHFVYFIAPVQLLFFYFFGLYDQGVLRSFQGKIPILFFISLVEGLLLVGIFYFSRQLAFPRSVTVIFVFLVFVLVLCWRLYVPRLAAPKKPLRVLLVGYHPGTEELAVKIKNHSPGEFEILGIVADDPLQAADFSSLSDCQVLGSREELPRIIAEAKPDEVIIVPETSWRDRLIDSLAKNGDTKVRVSAVPSVYEILIGKMKHLYIYDVPLIEVVKDHSPQPQLLLKSAFDYGFGCLLLLLALPAIGAVALLIRVFSGPPVFYVQERVGKDQRPFKIIKFRTMIPDAEAKTGPTLAAENDSRVTKIGRFLRDTRLDELPQLFNVIKGEMSFVGPRPERPIFVQKFLKEIPGYAGRFKFKPGLTGYAQINGSYHTSAENKLKYDLAYIHNWSLLFDLSILFETVKVMLTKRGT